MTLEEIISRMDEAEGLFCYEVERLANRLKGANYELKELSERYQEKMAQLKEELKDACASKAGKAKTSH